MTLHQIFPLCQERGFTYFGAINFNIPVKSFSSFLTKASEASSNIKDFQFFELGLSANLYDNKILNLDLCSEKLQLAV